MSNLNKEWAFNYLFYLCPLIPAQKILIISNHVERTEIDFSIFSNDISFAFPERYKSSFSSNTSAKLSFFELDKSLPDITDYQLIIVDLEDTSTIKLMTDLSENVNDSVCIAHLDWAGEWRKFSNILSVYFGFLGGHVKSISDFGSYKYYQSFVKWTFHVVPGFHKPIKFVRSGFRSTIPTDSTGRLMSILKKIGGFYIKNKTKIIITQNKPELDSPIETIIRSLYKQEKVTNNSFRKIVNRVIVSGTKVLLIDVNFPNKGFIVRLPMGESALLRLKSQYEILKYLVQNNVSGVPKPIILKNTIAVHYFIQTRIEGVQSLKTLLGKYKLKIDTLYAAAFLKITDIHARFGIKIDFTESDFEHYIGPMLDIILQKKNASATHILKIEQFLKKQLNHRSLKVSVSHGDYKIENCIFDHSGQLKGVIDWDMSEKEGLILIDVASIFSSTIRLKYFRAKGLAEFMLNIQNIPLELLDPYKNYCTSLKVDTIDPMALVIIYWLDRISKLLKYRSFVDEKWCNKNVYPVLNRIPLLIEAQH